MKQCERCKVNKPPEAFERSTAFQDGRRPYCKTCKREMYETQRDEKLAAARAEKERNLLTKQCSICNLVKPIAAYGFDATKPDGFRPHCKACGRILMREYRSTEAYRNAREREKRERERETRVAQ